MARVRLVGQKKMNHIVSHIPGVRASVRMQAQKIGAKAEARLASHFYEGDAEITITYGKVDSFVNLEDEAALSIEYGHNLVYFGRKTNKHIKGLHILSGAAGLLD